MNLEWIHTFIAVEPAPRHRTSSSWNAWERHHFPQTQDTPYTILWDPYNNKQTYTHKTKQRRENDCIVEKFMFLVVHDIGVATATDRCLCGNPIVLPTIRSITTPPTTSYATQKHNNLVLLVGKHLHHQHKYK